jgi:hypothetical protein
VLVALGFALRGPLARWTLRFGLDDEAVRRLERSGELPQGALSAIVRGAPTPDAGSADAAAR